MSLGSAGGITTRSYKSGSIVYFENDRSEYIYILKTGRVILSYLRPETGEELKEEIKPGEFFGVKSALGKYPREETAQTFGSTDVLVLTVADFERLVLGNVQVVKKMLRVFSNQLRKIGKAEREVLGETNSVDPRTELFKIGEYYYRAGKYDQALHAYKKYMEHYPDSKNASTCMQRINDLQSGNIQDIGEFTSSPVQDDPVMQDNSVSDGLSDFMDDDNMGPSDDMVDFDVDDNDSDLSGEMDNFIDSADDDFSDFGLGEPAGSGDSEIEHAKSAINCKNYNEALLDLENIITVGGADIIEALYLKGKVLQETDKLQDSLTSLSEAIKQGGSTEFAKKSMLEIAKVYKKAGKAPNAKTYLEKVINTAPMDETTQEAQNLLGTLG